MKNKFIILVFCLFILVGCSTEKQNNIDNNKTNEVNASEAKIKQIQNLKETDLEIPKFTIVVKADNDGPITEVVVKNLQMYEFTVDVPSYDLDQNSRIYRDTFAGIKFTEILDKLEIKDYDRINFVGSGKITVTYLSKEINDTMYLVFYRNGKLLSEVEESPAMLISPTLRTRYWVPSLVRMEVE